MKLVIGMVIVGLFAFQMATFVEAQRHEAFLAGMDFATQLHANPKSRVDGTYKGKIY